MGALWYTIVISALNILGVALQIAFGSDALLQGPAVVAVVVFAIIIVLVVLPASRRAFTTS